MPRDFAGSAIKQNAGKLSEIARWDPTEKERKWLLLSGASDSPHRYQLSEIGAREARGGRRDIYLKGQSVDFVNMERAVGDHLYNRVLNLHMKKDEAKSHVLEFFNFCKENNFKPMLYYTGHGELPTGNWCLADGTISIEEIFDWIPAGMEPPTICTDSCFSGVWSSFCIRKKVPGFHCLSATDEYQAAIDHKG